MAEQVSRFKGLRRIAQSQEAYRSPSYQTHLLNFERAIWLAGIHEEIEVEVEATDLIFPLNYNLFEAEAPYNGMVLYVQLNDCLDILHISTFFRPLEIRNFPFYKFKVTMQEWPAGFTFDFLELHFYTFTNPRIIEDIKNG